MGIADGAFVPINIALCPIVQGLPPNIRPVAYGGFALAGIGVPWLAVWLLMQRRHELS